jgi:hypothetical protein
VIIQPDVDRIAEAARHLPPAEGVCLKENLILNLQGTVLDFGPSPEGFDRRLT